MRYISLVILAFIGFNAIVFPNANPAALALALVAAAILNLVYRKRISKIGIQYFYASWIITLFYLLIGIINGASQEAVLQTLIIYIISPVLWMLAIDLLFCVANLNQIYFYLAIYSILACFTVPVYVFLFQNYGVDGVKFFGSHSSNVMINDEGSGVTMHVLGSLIFLTSAFIAQPSVIRSKLLRIITLCGLVLTVFFGGRTMGVLSLAIGALMYLLYGRGLTVGNLFGVVAFFTMASGSIYLLFSGIGVDFGLLLGGYLDKMTGGDIERPAQMAALLNGAAEYLFMGAGHGIGVEYVRSDDFPWRYEAVYFALLFKIGVIGVVGLFWPFIFAIIRFLKSDKVQKRGVLFFMSSFVSVIVAGFTNPYPEAFAFQWMYLLPLYIMLRKNSMSKSVS